MRKHNDTYCGGDDLDKAAERMIQQEVLACQTGLVAAILSEEGANSIFQWDDVVNLYRYVCIEDGEEMQEIESDMWQCPLCTLEGHCDDLETTPKEVFEWWLVSSYLAPLLEAKGEVTLTDGQSNWWGRCCSGQSIVLDGLFQAMCAERAARIAR